MVGDPWKRHSAPVTCLDLSPDGREIVSGSEDGTVRRWNIDTGRQIAPPIETDGQILATRRQIRKMRDNNVICVWVSCSSKSRDMTVRCIR
jgi:WD40 repeat protein